MLRFQGIYGFVGDVESVKPVMEAITQKAKAKKVSVEVGVDFCNEFNESQVAALIFTGKDAQQYARLKPVLKLWEKAQGLCLELLVKNLMELVNTGHLPLPEAMALSAEMEPPPPKAWRQLMKRFPKDADIIVVHANSSVMAPFKGKIYRKVNLVGEVENGNFNLQTGKFRENPFLTDRAEDVKMLYVPPRKKKPRL